MAGGGLALVIVPPLTDATSWRATYVAALVLANPASGAFVSLAWALVLGGRASNWTRLEEGSTSALS